MGKVGVLCECTTLGKLEEPSGLHRSCTLSALHSKMNTNLESLKEKSGLDIVSIALGKQDVRHVGSAHCGERDQAYVC